MTRRKVNLKIEEMRRQWKPFLSQRIFPKEAMNSIVAPWEFTYEGDVYAVNPVNLDVWKLLSSKRRPWDWRRIQGRKAERILAEHSLSLLKGEDQNQKGGHK